MILDELNETGGGRDLEGGLGNRRGREGVGWMMIG